MIESDAFFIRHTGEKLNSPTIERAQGEVKVLFQGICGSYQVGQIGKKIVDAIYRFVTDTIFISLQLQ